VDGYVDVDDHRSNDRRWLPWLVLVLALSAALRLGVLLATPVRLYPDSPAYLALAREIGRLNLSADNGARTPLYPAFLWVLGYQPSVARVVQMLLGLAITAMLFWTIWTLTRRSWAAALGASMYGLSLTQIKYEAAVLTETPTTFLLVALATTLTWLWIDRSRHLAIKITVAGLCAGLVPLGRPAYVYVPFITVAAVLLWAPRLIRRWTIVVLLVATSFVPMLAWATFNYARFDQFGLSTMTGFDLTNKTGTYIKDAPARYATIRDIYVAGLEARGGHNPVDLIWSLVPRLEAATGESYPQLSKTFLDMNLGLLPHHQAQYWKNVASVFAKTFMVDRYEPSLPRLGGATPAFFALYKWLSRLINLAFLLVSAWWIVRAIASRSKPHITPAVWMAASALLASLSSAIAIAGSDARFGMPTQPYVVCVVLVAVCSFARSARLREDLAKSEREHVRVSPTA